MGSSVVPKKVSQVTPEGYNGPLSTQKLKNNITAHSKENFMGSSVVPISVPYETIKGHRDPLSDPNRMKSNMSHSKGNLMVLLMALIAGHQNTP